MVKRELFLILEILKKIYKLSWKFKKIGQNSGQAIHFSLNVSLKEIALSERHCVALPYYLKKRNII